MRPTRRRSSRLASAWSITVILSSFVVGCARTSFDVGNETDRQSMKLEIRNALTAGNCTKALDLSGRLYGSVYTDNEVRMLYASAHACNVGIQLYDLIDKITTSDFSNPDQIFKSLVKMFPSRTAMDTKLQSGWFAQDALQTMLKPGAVVGAIDQINWSSNNPGSVLMRDRVDDANIYLVFVAMSEIGTALNRYGFNVTDNPAALGYAQQVTLPWTSMTLVKADTSGAACALASSLMNMFDGIHSLITVVSGNTSSSLNNILTNLESAASFAGKNQCWSGGLPGNDGFTSAQCEAAAIRLRYRASCNEQDPIASFAAGIIQGINAGWL